MGYAAQMHSDYWDEPEAFRPERWLDPATAQQCADASFPFSAG
jgi:cytochrome P450